jgi:hypothetical protein
VLDTGAPAAPTLNPVTSPTGVTPQTISGTKEAYTSVWLNGTEIVSLNASTSWSYDMPLVEGSNAISLTCKDAIGNESGATISTIVLDTSAPAAPTLNPVTSPTATTPQTISGTKEADTSVWLNGSEIVALNASTSWSYDMPLVEGNNAISLTCKDSVGNESTATTSAIVLYTVTATVSFQDGVDGYTGTRDTKLMSQDPATNFGSAIRLEIDGRPLRSSLLYWDLASIPPGSIVHSVDVTVNITNASGHVYDFYESLRPWVESEATWNEYASGQSWETDGSDGFSDRNSTVLGSISGPKGLATVSLNAPGVATVQAWVDDPSSNHGFIILNYISASNGLDFSSRETVTVSIRPKLTVTYSAGSP